MKKFLLMISIVFICISLVACEEPECFHSETDWVIATRATCTTTGLKMLSCEKCGEKTQIIPAIGHAWKNATCTNPKTCDNCNLVEGSALGHSYISKVEKEATCTQQGEELFTCSLCNDSYTQKIEAKGHSYNQQATGEDICAVCNDESYATCSIIALSKIYAHLKDPDSAVISSIYAGKYNYKENDCVVVVTSLKAKNSYGAMVSGEYVSLFYLESKEVTYDMKGYAESQADYYQTLADRSFGNSKLEYLKQRIEYLYMAADADTISSNKTTLFQNQELDYIIKMSKILAGIS